MIDGVVNLLKPPEISSNTAANIVRNICGASKAGHTGTLDVGASGVLAVCLGKATKCVDRLMDTNKRYIAEIAFGVSTDTQDAYGKITNSCECDVTEDMIRSVIPRFVGDIMQITPLYSAAKQDGVPLYKLARAGGEIRQKTRNVHISYINVIGKTASNRFLIETECGKGTYIRTLAADIGAAMDTSAHMSFLLRTQTSGLNISGSYTFDELRDLAANGRITDAIIPISEMIIK